MPTGTVAILAQGTSWAVAVTHAFLQVEPFGAHWLDTRARRHGCARAYARSRARALDVSRVARLPHTAWIDMSTRRRGTHDSGNGRLQRLCASRCIRRTCVAARACDTWPHAPGGSDPWCRGIRCATPIRHRRAFRGVIGIVACVCACNRRSAPMPRVDAKCKIAGRAGI